MILGFGTFLVPLSMLLVARTLVSTVSRSAAYVFYLSALAVLGGFALTPPAVHAWGLHWAPLTALGIAIAVAGLAWLRRSRW